MSKKKIATLIAVCSGFAGVVAVLIVLKEHLKQFEELGFDEEDDVYEEHDDGWRKKESEVTGPDE